MEEEKGVCRTRSFKYFVVHLLGHKASNEKVLKKQSKLGLLLNPFREEKNTNWR